MILINSCKKDDKDTSGGGTNKPEEKYSLTINLSHVFGNQPVEYSTTNYITAAADTIRITKLSYYFTNIKLTKSDGSIVSPETYFLVDLSNPLTTSIKLDNIPKATYTSFSFLMGVDSAHNHVAGQGALDPGYGMFWPWNTGFIFYRIKGHIGAANTSFSLDLGGDENIMKYSIPASIIMDQNRVMELKMDVKEFLQNPNVYDFKVDEKDIHSTTSLSIPKLVENSKDMFSITSIQ